MPRMNEGRCGMLRPDARFTGQKTRLHEHGIKTMVTAVEKGGLDAEMARLFTSSQHRSDHGGLVRELLDMQRDAEETDFGMQFVRNLNVVLSIRKHEAWCDRVIRFIAAFLQNTTTSDRSGFALFLTRYLVEGTESREKHVRAKVVFFLGVCFRMVPDPHPDIVAEYCQKMKQRLFDRESMVRVHAINGLAEFQTPDVLDVFVDLLRFDPVAEVRRTSLLKIRMCDVSLGHVLDRARDVDKSVRRTLYQTRMREIDPQNLSLPQRLAILRTGFSDTEQSVQDSCLDLLRLWIENSGECLAEFMKYLEVVENSSIASVILTRYFDGLTLESAGGVVERHVLAVLDSLECPESIFVLRHCASHFKKRGWDLDWIPETSVLVRVLDNIWSNGQKENLFVEKEFLILFQSLDYSDEVGRRSCFVLLRKMLLNLDTSETLVDLCVVLIGEIVGHDVRDWMNILLQVIVEVKEMYGSPDGEHSTQGQVLGFVRSMEILKTFFGNVDACYAQIPFVDDVLNELIIPAINNPFAVVQQYGLEILGLLSLLHKPLAIQYLDLFLEFVQQTKDDTRISALHIVFDILAVFGSGMDRTADVLDTLQPHLDSSDHDVQVVLARGFGKMLVLGACESRCIVKKLVEMYFRPDPRTYSPLKQTLSFFIQAFASSSVQNQRVLSEIFFDVVLTTAPLLSSETFSISALVQQMLAWMDPSFMHTKPESHTIHVDLGKSICMRLVESPEYLKLFAPVLNRLDLGQATPETVAELLGLTGRLLKESRDKTTSTHLRRFAGSLVEKQSLVY